MPGFIAGKVFELCFPRGEVTERVRVFEYVVLSCLNYAFCSLILIFVIETELWVTYPGWFACWTFCVLLIAPVVLGFGMAVATEKRWFQRLAHCIGVKAPHHLGTAWEWFFREHPTTRWWVVARLRSGIIVYGFFGWESYMGNEPGLRDLFLERECKLDDEGNFEVIEGAGGIYLRYEDIEAIGFRPALEQTKSPEKEGYH